MTIASALRSTQLNMIYARIVCGFASYVFLLSLFQNIPKIKQLFFVNPVGYLTVNFLGGISNHNHEGWVLWHHGVKIMINDSCSGVVFYSFLFSYVLYSKLEQRHNLFLFLLLCYPLTIVINLCRILCATKCHIHLSPYIPERYHLALHMTVGLIVFLSGLIFVTIILNQFNKKESNV
ncbi:MAG: hypothetical protein COA79_08705 [Planctomycetota bacterium]|nr:MAG: hypothetical protein COA79_08705 [Planctomycetota bacterium]